jgi:hypothetical protein
MKNLRLDPFLYRDTCEEHGKNVPFIVEPQEVDFQSKEIRFVFYCKKCWHAYGGDASAWRGTLSFEKYNEMFGYKLIPDN